MDWLASFFLGAFVFGLLFCLASLLLGFGHLSLDGHGFHLGADAHGVAADHFAHGGDAGAAQTEGGITADAGDGHPGAPSHIFEVSPWNLTALMAFVTWFGGAGYLALTVGQLGLVLAVMAAFAAGLVGWSIILLFLNRVLLKGEARMDPSDYRLEGTVARVTTPISGGRIGEIVYSKGGTRHSDGARSLDGSPIERGAEVVVVRYERGIAYVEPWQSFVEGEARPAR